MRDLASRLVTFEATRSGADGTARVCQNLRGPLARLVGSAGFCSLLARAVAVAKADDPALKGVQATADGSLAGLGEAGGDGGAGVAVVAQLLGLLETFIGEPLTLRLVHDAWPGELDLGSAGGAGAGATNGEAS